MSSTVPSSFYSSSVYPTTAESSAYDHTLVTTAHTLQQHHHHQDQQLDDNLDTIDYDVEMVDKYQRADPHTTTTTNTTHPLPPVGTSMRTTRNQHKLQQKQQQKQQRRQRGHVDVDEDEDPQQQQYIHTNNLVLRGAGDVFQFHPLPTHDPTAPTLAPKSAAAATTGAGDAAPRKKKTPAVRAAPKPPVVVAKSYDFAIDDHIFLYNAIMNSPANHTAPFKADREQLAADLSTAINKRYEKVHGAAPQGVDKVVVPESRVKRWLLHIHNKTIAYIEHGKLPYSLDKQPPKQSNFGNGGIVFGAIVRDSQDQEHDMNQLFVQAYNNRSTKFPKTFQTSRVVAKKGTTSSTTTTADDDDAATETTEVRNGDEMNDESEHGENVPT